MDNKNKNNKILVVVVALVVLGAIIFLFSRTNRTSDLNNSESNQLSGIEGCYVANLAQDVYTLSILSHRGNTISGTLSYKNFEKDSSSGTFSGEYNGDLLTGEYVFHSEGMQSQRQVVFKKTDQGFVQGFGDVNVEGNREYLLDPQNVVFDTNLAFVKSSNCVDQEAQIVRDTVVIFGANLKMVSLTASKDIMAKAMDDYYKPYVSPLLLQSWKNDSGIAPGREASVPNPVGITVDEVEKKSDTLYLVTGRITTSTNSTGTGPTVPKYQVTMNLANTDNSWRLVSFEKILIP